MIKTDKIHILRYRDKLQCWPEALTHDTNLSEQIRISKALNNNRTTNVLKFRD